ncbi:MAG: glycosyltransferase family 2 protein [Chloroflexia bacterium]
MLETDTYSVETHPARQLYEVSAIIVNYNGAELLPRCIEALRRAAVAPLQIIVVDNGSTDQSSALCARHNVSLVRLRRNVGFARANNIGIRHAQGKHYLFLNTDCFLKEGAIEALAHRLASNPGVAVVGPRLLNADGTLQRTCHNFPSPLIFFLEQTMLWRLLRYFPGLRDRVQIASDHAHARPVDWLLGACLLVRGEAFAEARGFDEDFFFYWEEADLCKRLSNLGRQTVFEPAAEGVHLGGASSANPRLLAIFYGSLYRFYRKHFATRQLLVTRALARVIALLKAARLSVLWVTLRARGRKTGAVNQELAAWLEVARV